MDFFDPNQLRIIVQLILAVVLGCLMGLEREYVGKAAGARTFALVTLGATLFTILSKDVFLSFEWPAGTTYDPTRIAAGIIVGIGFLGAGLIIFRGIKIEGLTTAAGLWAAAAIGMAVGYEFYLTAIVATCLILLILAGMRKLDIEERLTRRRDEEQ